MSQFQLDTSGHVALAIEISSKARRSFTTWSDLSPFVQGYVEALFASLEQQDGSPTLRRRSTGKIGSGLSHYVGFSDLAPETLAQIIEDCERFESVYKGHPYGEDIRRRSGSRFWVGRQRRSFPAYPPLTVTLNDDDRVQFSKYD